MTTESGEVGFLRRAIELAVESAGGAGGPFGAVVVRDGLIVAEGTNLVTATNDPTAHAEVTAIRRACDTLGTFDLSGCDLYSSCEPCPLCYAASLWARVGRLFHAATRDDADDLHRRNRAWLSDRDGLDVTVSVDALAARLAT